MSTVIVVLLGMCLVLAVYLYNRSLRIMAIELDEARGVAKRGADMLEYQLAVDKRKTELHEHFQKKKQEEIERLSARNVELVNQLDAANTLVIHQREHIKDLKKELVK